MPIEIKQEYDGRWRIVAVSSSGARATIDFIDHDDPATVRVIADQVLVQHILRAGVYDKSSRAILPPGS